MYKGNFLLVQWWRCHTSTTGTLGLIPKTKILQATKQKLKKKKKSFYKKNNIDRCVCVCCVCVCVCVCVLVMSDSLPSGGL